MKYSKVNVVLGQGSTGVETSFRTPPSGEPWGYHLAFNPLTGKPNGRFRSPTQCFPPACWQPTGTAVHRTGQRRVYRIGSGDRAGIVEITTLTCPVLGYGRSASGS
jgi:hypothetical protein